MLIQITAEEGEVLMAISKTNQQPWKQSCDQYFKIKKSDKIVYDFIDRSLDKVYLSFEVNTNNTNMSFNVLYDTYKVKLK